MLGAKLRTSLAEEVGSVQLSESQLDDSAGEGGLTVTDFDFSDSLLCSFNSFIA